MLITSIRELGGAFIDPHLRRVTTATYTHADVHVREAAGAEEQNGLEGLDTEDGRLHQLDGAPVHLDKTSPALAVRHGRRSLLLDAQAGMAHSRVRDDTIPH